MVLMVVVVMVMVAVVVVLMVVGWEIIFLRSIIPSCLHSFLVGIVVNVGVGAALTYTL
jgi:hypothetical protein